MNPYHILGLGDDATEIDVKRAYARLLKQHRPDADPTGFQCLHEAYTHCLSHARYRAQYGAEYYDEEYEGDEPAGEALEEVAAMDAVQRHAAGEVLPSAVAVEDGGAASFQAPLVAAPAEDEAVGDTTQEASFNVGDFIGELLERSRHQHAGEVSRWLSGHEALYSLQLKQFLTTPVASALAEADRLPDDRNIHTVLEFFGMDGVGQHPWVAQSLQVLWQRMEDRREFDRLRSQHYVYAKPVDRMLFHELVSPRNWLRFLAILLCPTLPSRTRNVLLDIEIHAPYSARAQFNPDAVDFWRLAGDRTRLDWRRWLIVLLRLPWTLVVVGYIALVNEEGVTAKSVCFAMGSAMGAWFAWAAGTIAWRRLLRFNNERLHWDVPVVLACLMLGIALLAGFFMPNGVIPLCVLTMMFWFAQRNGPTYYAGLFAAVLGGALVLSAWMLTQPKGAPQSDWSFVIAGVYGAASVLAHDALYARIKHRSLAWARGQLGWLGWLLSGHAVATVGALMAGS